MNVMHEINQFRQLQISQHHRPKGMTVNCQQDIPK